MRLPASSPYTVLCIVFGWFLADLAVQIKFLFKALCIEFLFPSFFKVSKTEVNYYSDPLNPIKITRIKISRTLYMVEIRYGKVYGLLSQTFPYHIRIVIKTLIQELAIQNY